jgi:hypothetical protein
MTQYDNKKGLSDMMEKNEHGEERINYHVVSSIRSNAERHRAIKMELARAKYVCITDAIMNRKRGGNYVLEHLDVENKEGMYDPDTRFHNRNNRRTWKIKALCNEWGEPYKPGDMVIWTENLPYKDDLGRKVSGRDVNAAIIRGEGHLYKRKQGLEVDENGCIECDYAQAATLLQGYGVHYETGFAICGKREKMRDKCEAPDGTMKHVHYWRFKEVPPWEREEDKPKEEPKPKKRKRRTPAEMKADKAAAEAKKAAEAKGAKTEDKKDGLPN